MAKAARLRWLFLAGLLLALSQSAAAHMMGERVVRTGVVEDDLVVFGREVEIVAEVADDVIVAGGRISVDGRVGGDLSAAGGYVDVRAPVADDLLAAGGYVVLAGAVGDDVRAAGGNVRLTRGAAVAGDAYLAGRRIALAGRIGQDLRAAGRTVIISGEIAGDVDLAAGEIDIAPTAVIGGNLTYRSPKEARIAEGAQIRGAITHEPLKYRAPGPWTWVALAGITGIVWALGLTLVGIVLYLLLPAFTVEAAGTIGREPWKSLFLGLGVTAATPFAVVLLFVTVIGVPLGLVMMALYLVALVFGFLTAAFWLAEAGARRIRREATLTTGWRIVALVAAIALLLIVGAIPWLGGLVLIAAVLLGLGAWSLRTYRAYARA
jgi:cytoskeletal protein CcmA (bactofilin family)